MQALSMDTLRTSMGFRGSVQNMLKSVLREKHCSLMCQTLITSHAAHIMKPAVPQALDRVQHVQPAQQHARVAGMYCWQDVARRTCAVYNSAAACKLDDSLPARLARCAPTLLLSCLGFSMCRRVEETKAKCAKPNAHAHRCIILSNIINVLDACAKQGSSHVQAACLCTCSWAVRIYSNS